MMQSAWSAQAARDRLSSTTFLAALFHGILILGVTFSAANRNPDKTTSSMEVVLVTSEYEDREPSPNAVLLAQRNLVGTGNASPDTTLTTAPGSSQPAEIFGPVRDGGSNPARPGTPSPFRRPEPVLLARDSSELTPDEGEPERAPESQRSMLPSLTRPMEVLGRFDTRTTIADAQPRDVLISANTRESRIATYLNTWKTRVEQVGTLHFPAVATLSGVHRYPVLEVAINADGRLKEVLVRNSSGQRDLDQAAMEILRLAAPFEPFPAALRADYDVLRFAYEWRFSDGSGSVRANESTAG